MNLRELAESDNSLLLEDANTGFGTEIKFNDPDGGVRIVTGQYHRVGVDIDPGTGLTIPGNKSSVTVRLSTLGVIPDEGWSVETADISGVVVKGKVLFVMADRTAGRVTVIFGRT